MKNKNEYRSFSIYAISLLNVLGKKKKVNNYIVGFFPITRFENVKFLYVNYKR